MKFRTGRRQPRTIYFQHGEEPTETDQMVGAMDSPALAQLVVDAVNAYRPDDGILLPLPRNES